MAEYHLYAADISPYAQRVVLQLDYKGIPFTQAHPPGGFGSDEYGLINPIRKLPVLRVGEVHLPESEVIAEYLDETRGLALGDRRLMPEDPLARAETRRLVQLTIEAADETDALMDKLKGTPLESLDRSIDVHMSRIRAAIEDDPRKPRRVITVRGAGYVFAKAQD